VARERLATYVARNLGSSREVAIVNAGSVRFSFRLAQRLRRASEESLSTPVDYETKELEEKLETEIAKADQLLREFADQTKRSNLSFAESTRASLKELQELIGRIPIGAES